MKKRFSLFLIALAFFAAHCKSQQYSAYLFSKGGNFSSEFQKTDTTFCVKVQVTNSQKGQQELELKEKETYKIEITIQNCANKALVFDTFFNKVPNVWLDDVDDWNISFELYEVNKEGIENKAECSQFDIDWVINPIDPSSPFIIKPGESYSTAIDLFHYYGVNKKGRYHIYGVYKKGSYYVKSKNFVGISII